MLEPDVIQRIDHDFSVEDASHAVSQLNAARKSGGLARCIVFLAAGSLEKLNYWVHYADHIDSRDVYRGANYEDGKQVRNISTSFLLDEPMKLWICEVAAMMVRRGYALKSIETIPVSREIYRSPTDLGEGTAVFTQGNDEIQILKRKSMWTISCDPQLPDAFDISKPFVDVEMFCKALSGFILTRQHPIK